MTEQQEKLAARFLDFAREKSTVIPESLIEVCKELSRLMYILPKRGEEVLLVKQGEIEFLQCFNEFANSSHIPASPVPTGVNDDFWHDCTAHIIYALRLFPRIERVSAFMLTMQIHAEFRTYFHYCIQNPTEISPGEYNEIVLFLSKICEKYY